MIREIKTIYYPITEIVRKLKACNDRYDKSM